MSNAVTVVAFLIATMLAGSARATVMTYLTTQQLTHRAEAVVRGEVVQQQEVLIEGRLWSDTYFKVTETIKGSIPRGQILTVRQPGGETAVIGVRVAGAARFSLSENALLFLRPVKHFHVVVGMALGKYRIYTDERGVRRAQRELKGLAFARFDAKGRSVIESPQQVVDLADDPPLEQLERVIQAQLTIGGGR